MIASILNIKIKIEDKGLVLLETVPVPNDTDKTISIYTPDKELLGKVSYDEYYIWMSITITFGEYTKCPCCNSNLDVNMTSINSKVNENIDVNFDLVCKNSKCDYSANLDIKNGINTINHKIDSNYEPMIDLIDNNYNNVLEKIFT